MNNSSSSGASIESKRRRSSISCQKMILMLGSHKDQYRFVLPSFHPPTNSRSSEKRELLSEYYKIIT